ncbi:hypothetical protein HMPREF3180_01253 [Leptotrichia wadei]|uniref:Uncharacterized protein n=1 Tax=Leptotrichia wadei TaxID=157687 RepID=A0A134AA94_9FUSO|nr:hypothetical protein HMPREF3180_01253 [Leptotrichia wadei]
MIAMESFWKKKESNIEIQNIGILNNGKVEKNKLFLLEEMFKQYLRTRQ